jgi:hypothetical protein
MSTRQTRRQAALAATNEAPTAGADGVNDSADGNGLVRGPIKDAEDTRDFPQENVFLFWPNIIGAIPWPICHEKT